jgi:hypothetical protein
LEEGSAQERGKEQQKIWHPIGCQIFLCRLLAFAQEGGNVDYITGGGVAITLRQSKTLLV